MTPTPSIPSQALTLLGKKFPGSWKFAEQLILDRGRNEVPDWPSWCLLPMGGWYAVLSEAYQVQRLSVEQVHMLPLISAVGAWRYTQGVYQFSPEVFRALTTTPFKGNLPADVLYRMPEWCVYIDLEGQSLPGQPDLLGMFAFLEFDVNTERHWLRLVLLQDIAGGEVVHRSLHVEIGDWTLEDMFERIAIEDTGVASKTTEDFKSWATGATASVLPLILYLCQDEPDITPDRPGSRPGDQDPRIKVKGGWRLFPAKRVRTFTLGEGLETAIREARQAFESYEQGGRKGRDSHIRRPHWHGYWHGPRAGKQVFKYRWLPPIFVRGEEPSPSSRVE